MDYADTKNAATIIARNEKYSDVDEADTLDRIISIV